MELLKSENHIEAIKLADWKFNCGHQAPVFEVNTIHDLNHLVGYAKYINSDYGNVFFRGQTKLYDKLLPSLYRNNATSKSMASRNEEINKYVSECRDKITLVKQTSQEAQEGLLQHYGIKTRWLDIVDNLFIALWFAIHEYKSKCYDRQHDYVTRCEAIKQTEDLKENEYVYLLLLFSDAVNKTDSGCYKGETSNLVDLRLAAPSIFLRPHSQHALLLKQKEQSSIENADLAKNVCGIIKMKIKNVNKWLGFGSLISAQNVYPAPYFDQGYGILLDSAPERSKEWNSAYGSIISYTY